MRHIAQETDFSLKKIYLSLSEKREFFIFYFIIQKKKDLHNLTGLIKFVIINVYVL